MSQKLWHLSDFILAAIMQAFEATGYKIASDKGRIEYFIDQNCYKRRIYSYPESSISIYVFAK